MQKVRFVSVYNIIFSLDCRLSNRILNSIIGNNSQIITGMLLDKHCSSYMLMIN